MLPFRHAHYWVLALVVLTFIAFWHSYFSTFGEASFAHHLHGMTATAWLFLLIGQSYTIHNRRFAAHALLGRSSLFLMPLFTAGGLLATQVTILSDTPFNRMFGMNLAFADVVASLFVPLFFFMALRHRKNPEIHSRYLLATVFPLVGPVLSRLFANYVPGLTIDAPDQLYKFGYSVDLSFSITVAFLGFLIVRDMKNGKPVLPFTLGLVAVFGMFAYKIIGIADWWRPFAQTLADVPPAVVIVAGLVLGGAVAWLGWQFPASKPARGKGLAENVMPSPG